MLAFLLGTRPVPKGQGPQTERMLRWIALAILLGAGAILVGALHSIAGNGILHAFRFLAVGLLAAVLALVTGGAFGLLFGLPVSGKVVVVGAAGDGKPAPAARSRRDWFGDNNAMEEIVDWLTKIIVGLGLVQAREIARQFDRVAAAVSAAMGVPPTLSADGDEVVGGAILLTYLLLGFTGIFLWARRYLKKEWTDEIDEREAQREQELIEKSAAAGTLQLQAKDDSAAEQARTAVEQERAAAEQARDAVAQTRAAVGTESDAVDTVVARAAAVAAFPDVIAPGAIADDPWSGRFDGVPSAGGAVLEARVAALQSRDDQFGVSLLLRGVDETARRALAGHRARLYLHPTFRQSIRMLTFDAAGEIKLALVCWGSFTVGAQLESGQLLELDLSRLPDAPRLFRER